MGFSSLLTYWQEQGLDPILLGQPKLWATAADITYLINSAGNPSPTNGQALSGMTRYVDNAFNLTQVNTTNRAVYTVLSSQPHPYGYIGWTGSLFGTGSQGQYAIGTKTDFSFMHQLNGKFTVYHIFKNDPNEAIPNSKFMISSTQSTGNRGVINYIANTSDIRNIRFDIRNDTGGVNATNYVSNFQYNRTQDLPVMLWSYRCDLSVGVGNIAMWGYRNGILDNTALLNNAPSNTAASFSTLRMGNRSLGDGRYDGYLGEYIIFQGLHDEATHLKVCNYLKDKWRIS